MSANPLLTPLQLGALALPNRIVMAPLSRMRAEPDGTPKPIAVTYYGQRASAGLIFTEGTSIAPHVEGFPCMPGIYKAAHVDAWRAVTDAVHARGGRIVLQIVHHGRTSHSSYGAQPVGPSAISAGSFVYTPSFQPAPHEMPRALGIDELPAIVDSFRQAAIRARTAGFDGVEIHGANGYLLDQFLQDASNQRQDNYGGSIENRARLLLEVVDVVGGVIGSDRTGVRLSPYSEFNGISDSDPVATFGHAIRELSSRNIAWLHLIEPRASTIGLAEDVRDNRGGNAARFRGAFSGAIVSAGAYTRSSAIEAVSAGSADAIAFGRLFIANPDLVERLTLDAELNPYDRSTFYGGEEKGYTDYSFLGKAA